MVSLNLEKIVMMEIEIMETDAIPTVKLNQEQSVKEQYAILSKISVEMESMSLNMEKVVMMEIKLMVMDVQVLAQLKVAISVIIQVVLLDVRSVAMAIRMKASIVMMLTSIVETDAVKTVKSKMVMIVLQDSLLFALSFHLQ